MIPEFDQNGNLPPGIYTASCLDIQKRFAYNNKRKALFSGLQRVLSMLQNSNCMEVYLNGSFITNKEHPSDYDLCWEPTEIRATPEIRQLLKSPLQLREQYLGDIFPRLPQPPYFLDHVVYWQKDIEGNIKGIIRVVLKEKND